MKRRPILYDGQWGIMSVDELVVARGPQETLNKEWERE